MGQCACMIWQIYQPGLWINNKSMKIRPHAKLKKTSIGSAVLNASSEPHHPVQQTSRRLSTRSSWHLMSLGPELEIRSLTLWSWTIKVLSWLALAQVRSWFGGWTMIWSVRKSQNKTAKNSLVNSKCRASHVWNSVSFRLKTALLAMVTFYWQEATMAWSTFGTWMLVNGAPLRRTLLIWKTRQDFFWR